MQRPREECTLRRPSDRLAQQHCFVHSEGTGVAPCEQQSLECVVETWHRRQFTRRRCRRRLAGNEGAAESCEICHHATRGGTRPPFTERNPMLSSSMSHSSSARRNAINAATSSF